jgi:hypothetical protein
MQTGITQNEFESAREFGTYGSNPPAYKIKKYRELLEKHKGNPTAIKEIQKAAKEGTKSTKKTRFKESPQGRKLKYKKLRQAS